MTNQQAIEILDRMAQRCYATREEHSMAQQAARQLWAALAETETTSSEQEETE